MPYLELQVTCEDASKEIFITYLADFGFDGFLEQEKGILAYIDQESFDQDVFDAWRLEITPAITNTSIKVIEPQNWNQLWESSFHPVLIDDECVIRATFHDPKSEVNHEIVIDPQMAFGTGHHETTEMMVRFLLKLPVENKSVFDFGCGTGVLAILASQMKASSIHAIDYDQLACDNTEENVILNKVEGITVTKGTIESISNDLMFDLILANINKNVILSSLGTLRNHLNKEGLLVVSGFFDQDLKDIQEAASVQGFKLMQQQIKNHWASAIFQLTYAS